MREGLMRKMTRWVVMGGVLAVACTGYGQQANDKAATTADQPKQETVQQGFQLVFVAREVDENGKVVNSRRFDTMIAVPENGPPSSIRTGAKIPVSMGSNTTYTDVGVSFDVFRPRVLNGNRLAMQVTAEISSLDPATNTGGGGQPTIRQNRWVGDVQVSLGEHKVIFRSDDLASKGAMQIEVTATRVN